MTIETIKSDFGIESNDPTEIKKQLKEVLREIHPDKNDGKFKTKLDELNYQKILEAIDYLAQDFSLVPKVEITSLATLLRDTLPNKFEESKITQLAGRGDNFIKALRNASLFPKVSSTLVTAIISFLWLFPSTIVEHPILSHLIRADSLTFTAIWCYSLFFTGGYWVVAKQREEQTESSIKKLNLESVQNSLFESYLNYLRGTQEHMSFTKEDFIRYLTHLDLVRLKYSENINSRSLISLFLFRRIGIDLEMGQILADLVIVRALDKDLLIIEKGKRLSDLYKLQSDYN